MRMLSQQIRGFSPDHAHGCGTETILPPVLSTEEKPQQVWVVFNGQTDVPWLRLLRPRFRHCYVVLQDAEQWISIDPMLNRMDIRIHTDLPPDFDLPGWLAQRGQTVVRGFIDRSHLSAAPWRPFTCVEAVKRVLGLHARLVFTPWQLYCHLIKPDQTKEIFNGKPDLNAQNAARATAADHYAGARYDDYHGVDDRRLDGIYHNNGNFWGGIVVGQSINVRHYEHVF